MNLHADFISSIRPLLGNETESFLSALSGDASVSFRQNPSKVVRNPMEPVIPCKRVPWSQWGFYLEERPAFTFDPFFHAGYYYVQEASSMFVEYVARELVNEPVMCLDLCAAPGGKSISLLSVLPEGSLLVSNELVRQRAHVLSETMSKFGHPNVMVTNNRAKDFSAFPHLFDLVLVDAPCSGEGMFRKDEMAVEEWSRQNVEMCAVRQRDILNDIWPALKPGGLLIYSTCTYNTSENEENAIWIADELGAEFVNMEIEKGWGISSSFDKRVNGYRFFPHKTRGEGLFVTLLRKPGSETKETVLSRSRAKNQRKPSLFVKDRTAYTPLLLHPDSFHFIERDNRIVALPAQYSEILVALGGQLKVVSMGIEIGEKKGKDFIPSHALAMSRELHFGAFPMVEVTYEEAISYLRREAVSFTDAPKGYVILVYKGEPLGFVKNLGNRANNLYPHEWRIRSGYLPEKKTEIFTL
ncbi:MAG: rRNA cytosine-C5-methyltransferase [Proteiniphilum sp.]|jgi:16S rRNA (cytosine1407-C5)-methyltransferase|uniref:methyltransferase RsmF C-terminal domain-like protein n=1 Tax=Proteiniphilum sp. TaxID=1926877 RepID=UPI002B1F2AB3|nr:rRNA cytosine-C5-methyltransferase [Proteiniphilum sp.]MEA5128368.1 rRNA cytosine-C5-methyltransferase [Proteiniphilum sp.]